jgi:hypothetical protein
MDKPVEPSAPEAPSTPLANATATASAAVDMLKSKVNTPMMIFLIVGVVITFLTAYVIYWWINRTLNGRKKHMIAETDMPIVGTKLTSFPADAVPSPKNGKRLSFTFWMYLYDVGKYHGVYRHVFHRGDRNGASATPHVMLDAEMNKLLISLSTEGGVDVPSALLTGADVERKKMDWNVAKRGVVIDYIPIQRWVHIAVIFNEEINGGTVTVYVDGDLVKSVDRSVKQNVHGQDVQLDLQSADLDKKGNVYIGGTPTDMIGPGFSGLVSRITFYNYDINIKDVYNSYKQGPLNSLMGKFGYGVRSPVYRVG